MLQVARLAPRMLGKATQPVTDFLRGQFNRDGGVKNRQGKSDLYYTVFALDALAAFDAETPGETCRTFVNKFGDGAALDFVHKACLARAWSALGLEPSASQRRTLLQEIEMRRTADGGYSASAEAPGGTAYHCFLALGAYQDLKQPLPDPQRLLECLRRLRSDDGAWANRSSLPAGTTTATAAAVALLRQLDADVPQSVEGWLWDRLHPQGGFLAIPSAPIPDLLSTATALHALTSLGVDLRPARELCLDFLDSLWDGKSFCGTWTDGTPDSEYTFYALLALGHLSL